jgi:hypothetical protein
VGSSIAWQSYPAEAFVAFGAHCRKILHIAARECGVQNELYAMVTNNNDDRHRPSNLPPFLIAGTRPSLELSDEKMEAEHPESELHASSSEDDPVKQTVRLERYTKWLMVSTVFSIFCTGWIVWSIVELRVLAEQQAKYLKDGFETSRYAVFAANRQAEAIEKTNELAADASRNQLRAYVSLLAISTQNAFDRNMSSSFSYKNVGQTPAIGLRTLSDAKIVTSVSDVKPPRTYSNSYGGENIPTNVLGSGIDASDAINRELPAFKDVELSEFRTGLKIYVVWGVIYYSDVFGKDHYTRFCRYFKNGELNRWMLCQTDNDSN